jgi:SRSO17 transposase
VGYDISYDDLVGWEADLGLLTEQVAGSLFTRPEPRATFADLVRGLLADVPRKNSWQLAEHVGHGTAHRLEWLLGGAKWDADALRDRVRDYVVATLGAEDGVLIADDTQVIKKGDKSVGVAPQHCGATGQTENCQVLPMLAYASAGERLDAGDVISTGTMPGCCGLEHDRWIRSGQTVDLPSPGL